MALSTHVTDRVASQLLVEITNFQNRGATTVNTTILGFAADDVVGFFEVYAGVAYDDTDARHIPVAVEGVIALLIRRGKQSSGERRWRDWLESARALGRVEGRNRVTPDSSSLLQPSTDDRITSTPRPAFDDRRFDSVLPNFPTGGGGVDA